MYPSIMIGKNICYTTRIDDMLSDAFSSEDYEKSPTGAKFCHDGIRRGMVPKLLEDLMSQRDVHKAGREMHLMKHNVLTTTKCSTLSRY